MRSNNTCRPGLSQSRSGGLTVEDSTRETPGPHVHPAQPRGSRVDQRFLEENGPTRSLRFLADTRASAGISSSPRHYLYSVLYVLHHNTELIDSAVGSQYDSRLCGMYFQMAGHRGSASGFRLNQQARHATHSLKHGQRETPRYIAVIYFYTFGWPLTNSREHPRPYFRLRNMQIPSHRDEVEQSSHLPASRGGCVSKFHPMRRES